jgi:hypothetical protein
MNIIGKQIKEYKSKFVKTHKTNKNSNYKEFLKDIEPKDDS